MGGSEEDAGLQNHAGSGLPPRLTEDPFYLALASSHRRHLLYYLLENRESSVEELVSVLSGREITPAGTMQTPKERAKIRLQLSHNHLPRLAEAGLIAYDPDPGTVQLESLHPRVVDIIRQSVEAEQLASSE